MTKKKILLWNPISNHGHLNLYLEIYSQSLIRLGYDVYFLADLDPVFESELMKTAPTLNSIDKIECKPKINRYSLKWFIKILKYVIQFSTSLIFRLIKKITHIIYKNSTSQSSHINFNVLTKKLKDLTAVEFNLDLIICMYLDMTHLDFPTRRKLDKMQIRWFGLLFHPNIFLDKNIVKLENWFKSKTNYGAIFFTNTYLDIYNKYCRLDQYFALLPDVTRQPKSISYDSSSSIRKAANGRTIIGMIGAIDGNKKLPDLFLKLSLLNDFNDCFFVMAGETYDDTLENDVLEKIRKLSGHVQENLIIYNEYIESENEFDSLLNECDILFACYKDFNSSANILAKSATFRKPIIVTRNTWIGDLTSKFGIGLAISNLDLDNVVREVREFISHNCKQITINNFDEYLNSVSIDRFELMLGEYVNGALTKRNVF